MTLLPQIPASYASARYAQLKKAGGLCACGRASAVPTVRWQRKWSTVRSTTWATTWSEDMRYLRRGTSARAADT
jgi:hypothetical protein